jgi:MATE family multidrug resistance protein
MAVLPINVALQWLLVWSDYSIGVKGAPIATSISNILITVALCFYIANSKSGSHWGGWDASEAFNFDKIKIFLSLGIPGVIMTCAEWWAFEIVALAAGVLGEDYLAVQSVIINTTALTYMFPLGLSVATTIRVGFIYSNQETLWEQAMQFKANILLLHRFV